MVSEDERQRVRVEPSDIRNPRLEI
jgi:hypothetical protein